ncbi:unnamed protein product [Citrullus colocynthis]|uniref:Uncharacterized protein n=1 Tax=Citrullus colocynthis TaxID=252529 RepID=A0ABP0Y7G1_9ROSI
MIKFFRQAIIHPFPTLALSRAAPHTRAPPPPRPPPPSSQPRTPSPVNVFRPSLSPSRFCLSLTLSCRSVGRSQPPITGGRRALAFVVAVQPVSRPSMGLFDPSLSLSTFFLFLMGFGFLALFFPFALYFQCSRLSFAIKHPATAVTHAGVTFGFDVLGRLRPFYSTYQEFLPDFQFGLRLR